MRATIDDLKSWDWWVANAAALGLKGRRTRLWGPCPAEGIGTNRFFVSLKRDGSARFGCRGCGDGPTAWRAVTAALVPSPQTHQYPNRPPLDNNRGPRERFSEASRSRTQSPSANRRSERHGGYDDRDWRLEARRLWQESEVIPLDAEHPARRWIADRNLWHPQVPSPPVLRWHPKEGAVLAAAAELKAWRTAWPWAPRADEIMAAHLVFVEHGGPYSGEIRRWRRSKLTLGGLTDRPRPVVCLVGSPDFGSGVGVVEGLADGLAVAAREPEPALVMLGTALLAKAFWLAAEAGDVAIYADRDEGTARSPGLIAARTLRDGLAWAGVSAQVLLPMGDDPADAAAGLPFGELDGGELDTEARREAYDTSFPEWEAYRQVAQMLQPAADKGGIQ